MSKVQTACDVCTQGVMDQDNQHLHGRCTCNCHGVVHAPDCDSKCGGTYVCPRCDRTFGWCIGSYDATPALCDGCANVIQEGMDEVVYAYERARPTKQDEGTVKR